MHKLGLCGLSDYTLQSNVRPGVQWNCAFQGRGGTMVREHVLYVGSLFFAATTSTGNLVAGQWLAPPPCMEP